MDDMPGCRHPQPHLCVDDDTVHLVLGPKQPTCHTDVDGGLLLIARDHPHHYAPTDQLLDRLADTDLQLILDGCPTEQGESLTSEGNQSSKGYLEL